MKRSVEQLRRFFLEKGRLAWTAVPPELRRKSTLIVLGLVIIWNVVFDEKRGI